MPVATLYVLEGQYDDARRAHISTTDPKAAYPDDRS